MTILLPPPASWPRPWRFNLVNCTCIVGAPPLFVIPPPPHPRVLTEWCFLHGKVAEVHPPSEADGGFLVPEDIRP